MLSITDLGAAGDGRTECSAAIQAALDAGDREIRSLRLDCRGPAEPA